MVGYHGDNGTFFFDVDRTGGGHERERERETQYEEKKGGRTAF